MSNTCKSCDANPVYAEDLCEHCHMHLVEQVCDCCGEQCPTGFEVTQHGRLCEECCDNMELEL